MSPKFHILNVSPYIFFKILIKAIELIISYQINLTLVMRTATCTDCLPHSPRGAVSAVSPAHLPPPIRTRSQCDPSQPNSVSERGCR